MKKTVDDSTVMSVHAQIKYKKSVWGVVKGFIEKNTWLGLEDFYDSLSKALMADYCIPPAKARSRRSKKALMSSASGQLAAGSSLPVLPAKHLPGSSAVDEHYRPSSMSMGRHTSSALANRTDEVALAKRQEKMSWIVIALLVMLVGFNVILYVKLWRLESHENEDIVIAHNHELLR